MPDNEYTQFLKQGIFASRHKQEMMFGLSEKGSDRGSSVCVKQPQQHFSASG